jgi:RNA polymerase sigma factor (sigma-70 family)
MPAIIMAPTPEDLLLYIQGMVPRPIPTEADDTALLERFVSSRDETAFAALVSRYGPMVRRVCRRILGDAHEAEDAFQAAFLVLARKAAAVRPPRMLPGWLHGVATRVAMKARAGRSRRRFTGQALPRFLPDSHANPLDELSARELLAILDTEIRRLPEVYRLPVILCCLEGQTLEEAARHLGWTAGSVKGRLERGRARLHERLVRRGLTLAAALAAAELSRGSAAALPAGLAEVTTQAATAFVKASGAIGGPVPAKAAALADSVLQSFAVARRCTLALLVSLSGILASGISLAYRPAAARQESNAISEPPARAAAAVQAHTDRLGDPLPAGAVTRLGTLRFRHEGEAGSLVFSPDGKVLAGMSQNGRIVLWNARTGQVLRQLPAIAGGVITLDRLIDFSPDGRVLAGLQGANQIGVWETATAKLLRTVTLPVPNIPPGKPSDIHTVRFSPDANFLAVAGDNHCYLVDGITGKLLHQFDEDTGGLAFSPNSRSLITQVMKLSQGENDLVVRSVPTGEVLRRLQIPHGPGHKAGASEELVSAIVFSPDGQTMATGGGKRILMWDVAAGKLRTHIEIENGYVMNLAFTPDGQSLVSGTESGGRVHVWDPVTGKERRQFDSRMGILRSLALSPNGHTVAVGGVHNTIRLWDVASGKELLAGPHEGHDAQVNSVAYSPDGARLVSGGENRQVWIWDVAAGRPVHVLRAESARQVTFSPDGRYLASLSPGQSYSGKVVHIYDTSTWQELHRLTGDDAQTISALAFTPDGRMLVAADWQRAEAKKGDVVCNLNVWEPATGRRLQRFSWNGLRPECVAVSPDGRTVAVAGCSNEASIRLCDIRNGEELLAVRGGQVVLAVAFSPDGRTLLTGGADQTVRLWELATGSEILALQGGGGDVAAVAFSPRGRLIAAASGFGGRDNDTPRRPRGFRLWDSATGGEIRSLGRDDSVTSLAFSPDGSTLASGLQNSTVLLWEMPPAPRLPRPKGAPIGPKELDALWSDLAGADARKAHTALWTLIAVPEKAVSLAKARLSPAPALDLDRVRRLLVDLDSDQYPIRQAATEQLQSVRDEEQAQRVFRQALAGKPSLEVRRRLEGLLAGANSLSAGETLRGVRAVEVLERIDIPEARQVLQALTKGSRERRLTREATAALGRLAR